MKWIDTQYIPGNWTIYIIMLQKISMYLFASNGISLQQTFIENDRTGEKKAFILSGFNICWLS